MFFNILPEDETALRAKLEESPPALKVKILIGAQAAYACIVTPTTSLDVRLGAGHSAWYSLRESALEDCNKAQRLINRAALLEQAADQLEREKLEERLRSTYLEQAGAVSFDVWLRSMDASDPLQDSAQRLLTLKTQSKEPA